MGYNNLANYYKIAFNFVHTYKICTLSELEDMVPFERDVYMTLMKQHIEKMNEDALQQQLIEDAKKRLKY
jgi:hypothetical protein